MIYEFLYRGPIAAEKRPSAWHVILAEEVTSFGETKLNTKGPMTPEQSEAAGFPLSAVLAEINTTVMAERDAAQKATADETEAHNATKAVVQQLSDQLANVAVVAERALDQVAEHSATIDDLKAQIAAAAEVSEPADASPSNPVLHALTLGLAGK